MAQRIHDGSSIPDGPYKDPDSTVDYGFDWSDWLATGETIASSSWTIPAGLTNESDAFTDTTTAVFISGGVVDEVYTITNTITTNNSTPRVEDRSVNIRIKEK